METRAQKIDDLINVLNRIAKILAFLGILISVLVKINQIFGFVDLNKLKIKKKQNVVVSE